MADAGIKLKLEGFDELLKEIEDAGRSMNSAVESCMRQSAQTMQNELKSEMQKAGVDSGLISRMPAPTIEIEANTYTARVGYVKGTYNENDPSDGYKVVFLNYGTPHRSKHGKVAARGFIQRAKSNANKKIKKQQKETLVKILERLKK